MDKMREMVLDAKAGDMEAFGWLYKETYNRNYYIVIKMVKTEQDTLDILQDTYVKAFQRLESYQNQGGQSFQSWTSKIASNTALDFLRKKKNILFSDIQVENEEDTLEFDFEDESIDNQPDLVLDRQETSRIVQEMLECLSEEQRICIILRYVQQMKISEIAEQCGCSENTVKSRLNYAKKRLQDQRETLEKKGVQLYNVAPFALLIFLMENEATTGQVVPPPMSRKLRTGWKEGVKTAASWSTGKLVLIATVSFLILSGVGGFVFQMTQNKRSEETSGMAASQTAVQVVSQPAVQASPTLQPTPRPAEDIYYRYLEKKLLPRYGMADLKQKGWTKQGSDYTAPRTKWLRPKGIISATISDMDSDGDKEMFVFYWKKKKGEYAEHEMVIEAYEIEEGRPVRKDKVALSAPSEWGPYWSEDTAVEGNFSASEMMAGRRRYFLFSYYHSVCTFGDGCNRGMRVIKYAEGKLADVQVVKQTAGGSSDFVFTGYTYTKKGEKEEILYSEDYDVSGKYATEEKAFTKFFERMKLDVREIYKKREQLTSLKTTKNARLIYSLNLKKHREKRDSDGITNGAQFSLAGKDSSELRKYVKNN